MFTGMTVDTQINDQKYDCKSLNSIVYIADPWAYGLLVVDVAHNQGWRIENKFMHPDEGLQKMNSAIDGIFSVALSPSSVKGR